MRVNKRFYSVFVAELLVMIVLGAYFIWESAGIQMNEKTAVVLFVNDEPITLNEFSFRMNQHKALVAQNFMQKGVQYNEATFWKTSFNGEIPVEILKEQAKRNVIRTKVMQIMARERGIVKDISYNHMLVELKMVNAEREKAIKNNQIIYGPVQYTENAWYSKITGDMIYQLKLKMTAGNNRFEEKSKAANELLEAEVTRKVAEATIRINDKVYKNIKV